MAKVSALWHVAVVRLIFNGDAVIDTSGTVSGGNVYGAYAQSGGSIDFKKGLVLDNQG